MSQGFSPNLPIFTISAPAKLNLCLDIIGREQSGYHKIQTVFFELKSLADELKFFEVQQSDSVSMLPGDTKSTFVPVPKEENLAYRALNLIKQKFSIGKSIHIEIIKNIPMRSGLGGGSSNAAATLKALNQIWGLNLSGDQLRELGKELGMDVPFFIDGKVARGTHYGEEIEQLPDIGGLKFKVSALPGNGTKEAFAALDLGKCGHNLDKSEKLIAAIKAGDNPEIIKNIHNDFETIYPVGAHLSGSGPSTFLVSAS